MPELSDTQLDHILTRQLAVAWAGERGDERPRLGWWDTQLDEEFGGRDLFERLLPRTGDWAVLVAAREAARRQDQFERLATDLNADHLSSLFHFGFAIDELIDDRLRQHQRAGESPTVALPGLREVITDEPFDQAAFVHWCEGQSVVRAKNTTLGREVPMAHPEPLSAALVAALLPLPSRYPLTYARITR